VACTNGLGRLHKRVRAVRMTNAPFLPHLESHVRPRPEVAHEIKLPPSNLWPADPQRLFSFGASPGQNVWTLCSVSLCSVIRCMAPPSVPNTRWNGQSSHCHEKPPGTRAK